MSRSSKDYLQHILDEAEYLFKYSQNLTKDSFLQEETFKRAFVRSLEIIGEATKNLPDEFKSDYPEVPWRRMAGIRDKLIHNYFGVDYNVVWDAVVNEIPNIKLSIEQIIDDIK